MSYKIPPGINYFWVTYDIQIGTYLCNTIDAGMASFLLAGNPVPKVPTVWSTHGYNIIQPYTGLNEHESGLSISTYPNPANVSIIFEF